MKKLIVVFAVALLCTACPFFVDYTAEYHVYYYPGYADGKRMVDPKTYHYGDTVRVLNKPAAFNKEGSVFLGWEGGYYGLYQSGDTFTLTGDFDLRAVWGGDPQDFEYTESAGNTEITITGYKGYDTALVSIPEIIEGKPVTAIGSNAFFQCGIKRVILPPSLKTIGLKAFAENYFFGNTLEIPGSVTAIGALAFQNCALQSVTFGAGAGLTSIGAYAFDRNYLISVTLPAALTTIADGAFFSNPIRHVTIGANVTIASADSLGDNGETFKTWYETNGSAAGIYEYISGKDLWIGPLVE